MVGAISAVIAATAGCSAEVDGDDEFGVVRGASVAAAPVDGMGVNPGYDAICAEPRRVEQTNSHYFETKCACQMTEALSSTLWSAGVATSASPLNYVTGEGGCSFKLDLAEGSGYAVPDENAVSCGEGYERSISACNAFHLTYTTGDLTKAGINLDFSTAQEALCKAYLARIGDQPAWGFQEDYAGNSYDKMSDVERVACALQLENELHGRGGTWPTGRREAFTSAIGGLCGAARDGSADAIRAFLIQQFEQAVGRTSFTVRCQSPVLLDK